jgi:tRNA threonylcarbamoyl adenosine modification protein (Sua5/YciO/YrdC/YwlC family)
MEKPLEGYLDRRNISAVAGRLRSGCVAVLPTDTIYGFHCVFSDTYSIDRIRGLKGRSKESGFILLASSLSMADRLVGRWPAGVRDILDSLWPAPLTAILPAEKDIPAALRPEGAVAVRIPAMASLANLIEKTGEPLVSTSVNVSGRQPLNRIAEIRLEFPGLEAYISRRGPGGQIPSTLLDLSGKSPRIVRPGRFARRAALAFGIDWMRGQ